MTAIILIMNFFVLYFLEGPKNYAYKVRETSGNEFTVCKVRGLTLNHEVSKIINFETIKSFVLHDQPDPLVVPYKNKIVRQKHWTVVTKPMTKKYNRVAPKRRVLENFSTLPFGYVEEGNE